MTRRFAQAGVAGCALFSIDMLVMHTVTALAGNVPWYLSEFTHRSVDWLWFIGLAVLALSIGCFAVALSGALRPSPWQRTAQVMLGIQVFTAIGLACFQIDEPNRGITWEGIMHTIMAGATFLGLVAVMLILAMAFHEDPIWRPLRIYSIATAVLSMAMLLLLIADVLWVELAGHVSERILVGAALLWLILVGARAIQVLGAEHARTTAQTTRGDSVR